MGLAKKGSRKIEVDGRTYRWVLSPDSGFAVLVIELWDDPGQRLEAFTGYESPVGLTQAVTPRGVAETIRFALREGWEPTERRRPPFMLHDVDKHVQF